MVYGLGFSKEEGIGRRVKGSGSRLRAYRI